jgi:hypothetical protein
MPTARTGAAGFVTVWKAARVFQNGCAGELDRRTARRNWAVVYDVFPKTVLVSAASAALPVLAAAR